MYIIVKENGLTKRIVNTTTSPAIAIDELGAGAAKKYVVAAYYGEDAKVFRRKIQDDKEKSRKQACSDTYKKSADKRIL